MKWFLNTIAALVPGLLMLTPFDMALAQPYGPHVRFGVYVGPPYYSPYYYPRPYYYPPYYPPVVVAPSAPPVYVEQHSEQTAPQQAAPQQNWWYYCADSKLYYPYAKECPAGWQRVAPQPPNG